MKINIQRTILCQEGVLFLRKNRILDKIGSVLKCVNSYFLFNDKSRVTVK
jgi:hypothetical protein